jgi:hypothetical protein
MCGTEEAKEKDPVHYSFEVPVEPVAISCISQLHAVVPLQHLNKEGRLFQTQSLSC